VKQYGLERTGPKRENTCSTILPANELRERAKQLVAQIEPVLWELSSVLYRIKEEQLYLIGVKNYASFDEYITEELAYSPRRARYLASIYDKFSQANIDGDVVNQIGSSKARLLARVVNEGNKEVWLERAKHTNYKELDSIIQSETQGKAIHGGKMGSISIPYYNGDTRVAWLEVVELVSKMEGIESNESVLEVLMAEYLSMYADDGSHSPNEESKKHVDYAILHRDNFRCVVADCRKRVTLQVHHVAYRSQRPDLIDDPKNKVTICSDCHNEIHRHGAELINIDGKWALKRSK